VLLVRHSVPEVDPARPAEEWRLSEEGRRRCGPLAAWLARLEPTRIVTSTEPKARETAELVGAELGLEVEESDGLRETARRTVPWLEAGEFRRAMRALFERPDDVVFGEESAEQALVRFSAALDGLGELTIVVSGGTVISLYAAARTGRDAFELWSGLELPDLVVI
jgi:2,3-bisphosphoglycerate-dependent phosphoglycerate mutase